MAFEGVSKVRGLVQRLGIATKGASVGASNTERDADGRQRHESQAPIQQLNPEQEQEAIKALNQSPAFVQQGLQAQLVTESGKPKYLAITNSTGAAVRQLPYEQLISIYLNRHGSLQLGSLLRRSA